MVWVKLRVSSAACHSENLPDKNGVKGIDNFQKP